MPFLAFLAQPALAEPWACVERKALIKDFAERYQEVPSAIGVTSDGNLAEVLTSKSGNWTLVISNPKDQTCVVASGSGWRTLRPKK